MNIRKLFILSLLVVLLTTPVSIFAFDTNLYWVGGTGNWSDASHHWATTSGGTPNAGNLPSANDNVFFDVNSGGGTATIDVANVSVLNLNMGDAITGARTGITINTSTNGITVTSDATVNGTISGTGAIILSGASNTVYGGANATFSAPVSLSANYTIDVATGSFVMTGIISGDGYGISKTGAGTLSLSGANTFTGGFTIKAGIVKGATSNNSFGANANVITIGDSSGSADATLYGYGFRTFANPITVATGSAGVLSITGNAATFTGAVTLNNNLTITNIDGANTLSGGITGTGNITINNTNSNAITISTTTVNHAGTITNSGSSTGTTTISAVIGTNVTGVVQNSATSQLTLSGNNTYTGLTDVRAGTLSLARAGGTLADTAPVQISGGTLYVAQSDTVGAVTILSGNITGPGTLTDSTATPLTTYTLTVASNNGTVTKSPNQTVYNSGTDVTLTATPNTGYAFSSWSGDVTGTNNTATIKMTGNKTVTANFISTTITPTTYTLTVISNNGTVTKNPSGTTYNSGTSVTLTAVPNTGYAFSSWSGDVTGIVSPTSVIMDSNKTITANFTPAVAPNPFLANWSNNRLFSHIRTWATTYQYLSTIAAFSDPNGWAPWMANHYDIMVWDDKSHPNVRALRPEGLHFIYSNFNNLGPQESVSWAHFKQWTDANVLNADEYENMFLHMKRDHNKNSSYDDTFDQFLTHSSTYNASTSLYSDSSWAVRDTSKNWTILSSPGSMIYMGLSEGRFNELNFNLAQNGAGLTLQWEYWNGNTWSALNIISDGTNNLSQNGKVRFFPPANWEKTKINADITSAYYVRVSTSSVVIAPKESTIFSEDYIPLIGGVFYVKGWDPANDVNGDGYVDDTEFASLISPLAKARFKYQSRPSYQDSTNYYGRRWMLNAGNTNLINWNATWLPYLMQLQGSKDTGVFEDNVLPYMDWAPSNYFWEYNTNAEYYERNGQMWAGLKTALGQSQLALNIGEARVPDARINTYGGAATVLETETWLEGRIDRFESKLALTKERSKVLNYPTMLEGRIQKIDGSEDRNKIFTLATYYLQAYDTPYAPTFYYYGGRDHRNQDNRVYNWFNAIEYNVGQPEGDYYVFATGSDPEKTSLTYKIFGREYNNALVLVKPLPYGSWNGSFQTGSALPVTATLHTLPGTYRLLNSDGTLGEPITQISLRNQEGAILIKTVPSSSHTINATQDSYSTINPKGAVSVTSGADQTFTITANTGYSIKNVIVDGVSKGALTSFQFQKVTANHTISVVSFACDKDISNPGKFKPKGSKFSLGNVTDPRTVLNFFITKPGIAKILFKSQLNLLRTNTDGCYDSIDIDASDIDIQNNKIKISSVDVPELNQPAEITFYNVNYNNPVIKRDGLICNTCSITSYDKTTHTLVVNVPGFSEYTIEEGAVCGNSILESVEQCDDGNTNNGDGCSFTCQTETTYTCVGQPSVCTKSIIVNPSGGGGGGGGGAGGDSINQITNVIAVPTKNSVVITWNTDRASLSWIKYGTTTSYDKETKAVEYFTSHQLTITNLAPKTTYHYQIKTFDRNNIEGTNTDSVFTTLEQSNAPNSPAPAYPGIPANFTFTKMLKLNMNSDDVKYLQIILNSDPATRVANTGFGSPGDEPTHFGPATKSAVVRFQKKYGISAIGAVGPLTRTKLNQLLQTQQPADQARINELLQMIQSLQAQIQAILLQRAGAQ